MEINFEFFGVLTRLAGAGQVLEVASGATVAEALAALSDRLPQLAPELERCACAVGDALVPRSERLVPGARLALLPPVAGG